MISELNKRSEEIKKISVDSYSDKYSFIVIHSEKQYPEVNFLLKIWSNLSGFQNNLDIFVALSSEYRQIQKQKSWSPYSNWLDKMKTNEINGQPNKIEASTRITGEIKSNADFRIDGYLNGSIITSGKVVIGKEGVIEGNIKCLNADIEGKLNGKIEASEILNLKSTCIIEGEVKISKLIVEAGASFNAKCSMKNVSEVKSIMGNSEKTA